MNTATTTPIAKSIELETANAPLVNAANTTALVLDGNSMDKMLSFAQMMSTSKITIPKHLQGNAGDCFAIVMQSMQWGMNPFAVAQKTHLVNGVLGYEAQLVNAVINSRAPITTRLNYEWFGEWANVNGKTSNSDDVGVTVYAVMQGETEPRTLSISMAQVGKIRNSPLWESDPRQQLAYLATKRWARLYCPDVILGVYTADEFEQPAPVDVTPKPEASKTQSIRDKLAEKAANAKKGQVIDQVQQPQRANDCPAIEKAVTAIEVANTLEELDSYANTFGNLGMSEAERKQVGVAYRAKRKQLEDVAAFEAQEAERLAGLEQ